MKMMKTIKGKLASLGLGLMLLATPAKADSLGSAISQIFKPSETRAPVTFDISFDATPGSTHDSSQDINTQTGVYTMNKQDIQDMENKQTFNANITLPRDLSAELDWEYGMTGSKTERKNAQGVNQTIRKESAVNNVRDVIVSYTLPKFLRGLGAGYGWNNTTISEEKTDVSNKTGIEDIVYKSNSNLRGPVAQAHFKRDDVPFSVKAKGRMLTGEKENPEYKNRKSNIDSVYGELDIRLGLGQVGPAWLRLLTPEQIHTNFRYNELNQEDAPIKTVIERQGQASACYDLYKLGRVILKAEGGYQFTNGTLNKEDHTGFVRVSITNAGL